MNTSKSIRTGTLITYSVDNQLFNAQIVDALPCPFCTFDDGKETYCYDAMECTECGNKRYMLYVEHTDKWGNVDLRRGANYIRMEQMHTYDTEQMTADYLDDILYLDDDNEEQIGTIMVNDGATVQVYNEYKGVFEWVYRFKITGVLTNAPDELQDFLQHA